MVIAFIGLGSNLGDRKANVDTALALLKRKCDILACSSIYETEPVGYVDQGWFLNCVVKVDTSFSPSGLLDYLLSIERELKRTRSVKDGPRTIDLDILFFGDTILDEPYLIIPHPRLHERLFVLIPFCELDPGFMHPVLGRSISDLFDEARNKNNKCIVKKFE